MDTNIPNLLNSTSSGKLSKQLDKKDGKVDFKISASVWNDFVADKGGKKIKNYIDIGNAMKSVTTYAVKAGNGDKAKTEEIVKAWTNEIFALVKSEDKAPNGKVEANEPTAIEAAPQAQDKAPADSAKAEAAPQAQDKTPAEVETAKAPADSAKAEAAPQVEDKTPAEVEPAKVPAEPAKLDEKAAKLESDKEAIRVKTDDPKVQECFDKATGLLAEIANMDKSEYALTSEYNATFDYDLKTAKLSDGRYIQVKMYDDGIDTIEISHDTTPDADGQDGADVVFHENMAQYDINHKDDTYDGDIKSGFDYQAIRGLAEKIFGKAKE